MEVTGIENQMLADVYLNPLLAIVDVALLNPELLEIAETSLGRMRDSQSTAQAVSGIMLDMGEVDKRQVMYETFKVAVKLMQTRKKQQSEIVKVHKDKIARRDIAEAMGF